ncbi:hypothetical protein MNV_1650001 [Candidatus Methanoperedens nitroreducens]|uniref:Uncharacterized protein n=1 Tax=Candidatus Methanoperedens nitratireducens TaxID=1392998 RepID=A0A284VLL5_9EURY|nr:hypothetical protein MNV_1650001 [Candidatus Methanoperedens nitroreducens]
MEGIRGVKGVGVFGYFRKIFLMSQLGIGTCPNMGHPYSLSSFFLLSYYLLNIGWICQ